MCFYRHGHAARGVKTGGVGVRVNVLCSEIGVDQYIIGQERYKGLPSFVGTKKAGLLASVKEKDVVEDEMEVGIGHLDRVC